MLFEMNRVLMCRNHPVLEFAYSSNAGLILEVGDVFDPSRVPVGMYVDGQPRPDSDSVTAWWRSRGIPATRDGLRTLLMATGIPSGKELLDRSMGLSLSDQYWIRPAGMDALRWEDLNFFHNDFDERLGKALFTGDSSRIGDVNTPDVTSAGDLPKRWIIRDDGVRTLIKAGRSGQEPDNERIAWKTARLLGIDHVEYRVGKINGARVSACDEMLSDTEELIPAGQIMRIFRKEDLDVIEIGTWALRFQCVTLPLSAWIVMSNMMTQTIGYGFRASLVAAGRQGLFLIPALFVLPVKFGIRGLQLCQPVADALTFVLGVVIVLGILRELKEKQEQAE